MERHDVSVKHSRCPYCHDEVLPASEKTACDACMGWSHSACWAEHGACAACGHQQVNAPPKAKAPAQRQKQPRKQGLAYGLGMVVGFASRHPRATWITLTLILAAILLIPRLRAMLSS